MAPACAGGEREARAGGGEAGEGTFGCATGRPAGAGQKAKTSGRFAQDDGESNGKMPG